jgi:2-dehydro-3-deoxyphosphogluconate aldolase/(4S)-4-hydroxy-2-oxoglutarate aldolase
MNFIEVLDTHRIIAIARGIESAQAGETIEALHDGGIRLVEVTLNTPDALNIIRRWRERYGEEMHIGAGTVMDVQSAQDAIDAGAQFLIAPHFDEACVRLAAASQIPMLPGALTPTEIVRAWQAGAPAVKVFPAGTVGPRFFGELGGPVPQIPLVAVGGVHLENVADFLRCGAVAAGVGSNLVNHHLIDSGRFTELCELAKRFVTAVQR